MPDPTPPHNPAEESPTHEPGTDAPPSFSIDAVIDPSVNFAALHNDVPAVKQLTVTNTGEADAEGLELRLWVDRELSGVWSYRLDRLDAGAAVTLNNIDLPLRAQALAHLTERDSADLHAEVRRGDAVLFERTWPIDALSFDEWEGLRGLPELLAAFVTPNHPVIERLLGDAALHLERATGDRSLSGYQRRDPARVRATAEAVYRAVGDLGLSYINPPASFEKTGQRVRLPDQLVERRMGTCLDLTLLLAALLEQAGLHPLVVMLRGHAFVGVWLSEERFPEPAVAEPLRLRKRVQLGEVVVFETTGLTHSPAMAFDDARLNASKQLEDPDAFHYAVDIRTARARHIRPLPLRVKPGTYDLIDMREVAGDGQGEVSGEAVRQGPVASSDDSLTGGTPVPREKTEAALDAFDIDLAANAETASRLDNWKRKLLDLSLRNRVLNHRETKKTIRLEVPDPAVFEDRLAEGAKFEVRPRAELMDGPDPRSAELHTQRTGEDARTAFLESELKDGRLHADLTEAELEKRLVEIYRAARLGLEESGANTLYLAFGFLHWYETPTSEPARLAPILLLPVGLERLPAGRGYRLSLLEEDPQINVTLLEKLRAEYDIDVAGLEELTEDEAGLDIHAILRRFREMVRDIPRWDVLDRVDLGLFSFNKFLMWRDLTQHSEQLTSNQVVRRLVDPATETASDDRPLPEPGELDRTHPPGQTLCPMDADSSQLAAVFAADEGHSFVLEGPPGTGKSQTITNLIAHALSRGKRVLFVSEKRAALEVVHRRLERVGLGPFCLELHSNKANKRSVLEQLGEALDLPHQPPPEGWASHAEHLHTTRTRLNELVEALHRDRPLGLSVYQAACGIAGLGDTPELELDIDPIETIDETTYAAMREAVDRLTTAAHAVGTVDRHPYRASNLTRYSSDLPDRLIPAIDSAQEAVQRTSDAATAALEGFGLDRISAAELSDDAIRWLIDAGDLLAQPHVPTAELLSTPDFDQVRADIEEGVRLGQTRDAAREQLLERYHERVFGEDIKAVRDQLADGMTALPILSWFKCFGPRKRMKLMLKPGGSLPSGAALLDELDGLIRVKTQTAQLADPAHPGHTYLPEHWRSGEADWDEVLGVLAWSARCRALFGSRAASAFFDESSRPLEMARLSVDERPRFQSEAGNQTTHALQDAIKTLDTRLAALNDMMSAEEPLAWGTPEDPGRLDTIASTLEAWRSDPGLLRDWAYFCASREAVEGLGLKTLTEAHAARIVPAGGLMDVFRKSLLSRWYAGVVAKDEALARFHRLDHERQIERFRLLDKQHLDLTARQVRAELSNRLPLHTPDANANSEVGILRRQMKLKRRHMPVRKLIASLPNLLPRLKPCLLMSPLSVAQYLDAATPGAGASSGGFDLVVFDEASQIPVWDAVGALARGDACVVVGDSKQLPPTSFFQKLETDDGVADENDFIELESILDECSASGLPSMRLLWHYRSRHESLIAFSNAHYYDHRLNTFPSPADEDESLGVTLKRVEGVYDRGKTCTNPAEAQALVRDVVERLKQEDQGSYRGLGIVTFSMAQQTLIEDLLDKARSDDPAIEVFFTDGVEEPVFIKNLENVQGDERAAIYFSVCYGPDASGKVAMNFGPLNREGGERRLNVAVTRARERVVVYSSLRAEQIDLSRTQAVGVAHLRGFLDYAERGAGAVVAEKGPPRDARPMAIDLSLADALRKRGYRVDLQVGLSGYRVALAVRDASSPGAYLLGIELDGPIYRSAPTARDRDRTRPGVMHGLGWRLHRMWSSDYLHDPEAELTRIEEAIDRARRGESAEPAIGHTSSSPEQSPPRRTPRPASEALVVYEPFVPSKPEGDSEAYYNPAKRSRVRRTALKIAKREAPIHRDLLAKRLTLAWQVGRLTSKAAEHAQSIVDEAIRAGELKRDGAFVWLAEQDPGAYRLYRVPADGGDAPRDIDEVPPQELEAAAHAVLRRMIAIPREDLLREIAERFGLSRVTSRVQPVIDAAVQAMLDEGRCVIDRSGKVALP